jgi:hypothetical protein
VLTFDHLACSAADLAEGIARAESALGVPFSGGGQHALMGTHNRLLGLGALYLEVIAIDPAAPPPGRARWFDLDRFYGPMRLTNWVARCDDLDAALARCPPGMGQPVQLERGPYRWRMAVPTDGMLPFDGGFPALIEWQGPAHPANALPDSGLRLQHFKIVHPQGDALKTVVSALLQDPRILIEQGPEMQLSAQFSGKDGIKWLA